MREMTVSEVFVRGRQEASKWLDRMTAVNGHGVWTAGARSQPTGIALAHFFEGAACADATAAAVAQMPECRARIIGAADALCRGRFDLLGYRGLDFGDPVDWHRDPISGRRAPLVHWSRLDALDRAVVGDSKVVWELNRHQWFLHLGQAYRFSGDERYAETFGRYVHEWMRANPAGMGINWASSLEVAFRLISWCWALVLFSGSRALASELLAELLEGIAAHARHVERYLSYYFSPNTHLTGEALGLFYAGALFRDLPRARRWRETGREILVMQCERQILADGGYFEQSTCYQRYTAEIYLHFLILAARNGIRVPDTVAQRLQRLLDFLVAVRDPNGTMPQIGDDDGGWLLPILPRPPGDLRGVLSVAAAFFGRPDYAWAAGDLAPEVSWLLGPTGVATFEGLTPAPPDTAPSRVFPDGGCAVMQSGWEPEAHQMIFDVGEPGCSSTGAHWHADVLSIQCALFGEPYLVDAGTYGYTLHPEWRDFFRSTAAHSTVLVDGQDQAVPKGPFGWQARPRARLRQWRSSEVFDFADAEHDAYACLADPVSHRRRVLFVKPRYWVIVDDLDGHAQHRVQLCFQFAPLTVTMGPDLWARARRTGHHALLIRPFATVALTGEISEGETAPVRGWISPDYGQRTPAPALIYEVDAHLPLRVVTLLLPLEDPLAPPPAVAPEGEDGAGPLGLHFVDSGERLQFNPHGPIIQRK